MLNAVPPANELTSPSAEKYMNLNLRKNSLWALAEVLFSSLLLFVLYKIVIASLGVKALGIWSLVLATTSLGRVADMGTAAALGRFVAATTAREDNNSAIDYAETAVISNFLLYAAIALLMWAPAYYGLSVAIEQDSLLQARRLLPFSLVSLVLAGLINATTGAIVGQHRSDQKSMTAMIGLATLFLVAILFVPQYGLLALAWAQIAQYSVVVTANWFLFLRNHFQGWTMRLPLRWRKSLFKELMSFGMKLQAIYIASILYDPVVKFLMSTLGGLEMLGYFEMAQRVISQVRQLVVMPNLTLIPSFAHWYEADRGKIAPLYHKALALTIVFGFPLLVGTAAAAPLISILWMGRVESHFVALMAILTLGCLINVIAVPAYYLALGIGYVKWNVYGAYVTTAGVCLLGLVLGRLWGGLGVAMATGIMVSCGAMLSLMTCRWMGIAVFPRLTDFRWHGFVKRKLLNL